MLSRKVAYPSASHKRTVHRCQPSLAESPFRDVHVPPLPAEHDELVRTTGQLSAIERAAWGAHRAAMLTDAAMRAAAMVYPPSEITHCVGAHAGRAA
jgi:hypothetical protein